MKKLVTSDEMRHLEEQTANLGLPSAALMENAGRAVADYLAARYPVNDHHQVLVVVGPGNNGGDGLVSARHLHDAGYAVVVYFANRPLTEDAKLLLLRERGVSFYRLADDPGLTIFQETLRASSVVLDAVFGTGRLRPLEGAVAAILDAIRQAVPMKAVVALDLPSGVNADTGDADPHAAAATLTVSLGQPKRGLVLNRAIDLVGELVVAEIGIPSELTRSLTVDYAELPSIRRLLPVRPRNSHKGAFGRVLVVAGSTLYTGAPVLAALGAERCGAGLVTIACPRTAQPAIAAHTLESTFLPLPDDGHGALGPAASSALLAMLDEYRALLVGPGIGRADPTAAFLADFLPRLVGRKIPLVVDADALTLISRWENWWEKIPPDTILTPHAGEMARLTGPIESTDRIALAQTSARRWGSVVVLKGAYTVIASATDAAVVLPFANPALASAGTGDVLAGTILGFLGQGVEPFDAAVVGGFVHGTAGEIVRDRIGQAGALASELARAIPDAQRAIREGPVKPLP